MTQKVMGIIWSVEKYYQKYYCSNCYDIKVNKNGVKCGTSLTFWENKGGLMK